METHQEAEERERKWLDLMASFKIHQVKKEGYPDSIGKRQFQTILEVNEIDMDLNVVRITKDMRRADRYSNKLHMLLLDDPLIKETLTLKRPAKSTRPIRTTTKDCVTSKQEFKRKRKNTVRTFRRKLMPA